MTGSYLSWGDAMTDVTGGPYKTRFVPCLCVSKDRNVCSRKSVLFIEESGKP